MEHNIQILDWNGNPFSDFGDIYKVSYTGERASFVPQIVIDGKNQINGDFWIRYFTVNEDHSAITGCVMTGPGSLPDGDPHKAGDKGLTRDVINILGLTNVYDKDSISWTAGSAAKFITFEVFPDNNGQPDYSNPIVKKGLLSWDGYPNIDEGSDIHVDLSSGSNPRPYIFQLNQAKPTVTFSGDVEEVDFDPNNPEETYHTSGFELSYENDYGGIFRDAIERRVIAVTTTDPSKLEVSGKGIGTFTSNIMITDLCVVQGDNPGENHDLWMNFSPQFKIKRQIKLIIKGEESPISGIGIPVSATKVYDGKPLCPIVENMSSNVKIEYSEDGINFSSDPISITDAGTKYVTVKITGASEVATYGYYSITITPRPIYITSDSASWNYNGQEKTCDWVTVQGHYDEDAGPVRIQTRFSPPEGSRKITGIPLIKSGDTMEIEFKGGQTEIGSSSNAFDFEVISSKPNNYDVRVEFGLLKVNLSSQDIYVFIRGNTKGTYDESDSYTWYESEKDRSCVYDGGIWTVSGWQVVAVSSSSDFVPDPDHQGDLWGTYGARDIEFVGKDTAMEVSGVYINNITDKDDENYWNPVIYESSLSQDHFRNINAGFSSRYVHFIVTPNRLKIVKNPITINIAGHHNTFDFNMIIPLGGAQWVPETRNVEGCDYRASNPNYDTTAIIYRKPNPLGDEYLTTPTVSACVWNEEDPANELIIPGAWYMHLEDDVHNGESDKDAPFESDSNTGSFINTNKNYEVTFKVEEDGWILINPIDVNVYIRGTQKTVTYDSAGHSVTGTSETPEIWWMSDCVFYNGDAIAEAVDNEAILKNGVHWVTQYKEQSTSRSLLDTGESDIKSDTNSSAGTIKAVKSTDKEYRVTYYRAIHGGYFEWSNNGDTGTHTDINELDDVTPDDLAYWSPVPYPMKPSIDKNSQDEENFYADKSVQFENEELGYPNHVYKNIIPNFILIENGSLTITPYTDNVNVSITGNTGYWDYDGNEHSVSGYSSESSVSIYGPDYISGPENPEAIGTNPGVYIMGLNSNNFKNINRNFSNVIIAVIDGWLQIGSTGVDQDVTGKESGYKVFDNTAMEIEDPEGATNPKRYEKNPDYDSRDPESSEWIEKSGNLEVYDNGDFQFRIESDKSGNIVDIVTSGRIDPLYLDISSSSETWIYDGKTHSNHTLSVKPSIENIPNMDKVMIFANAILNIIDTESMPEVKKSGSVQNSFTFGNISELFNELVQDRRYVIDDKLYENGEVIGNWDPLTKHTSYPNVIIKTLPGTLTVSSGIDTVTIRGLEKTVTYDGRPHTLIGYTVNPPINIPLSPDVIPDDFYENTTNKINAGEYVTHLTENDFDWPSGVANKIVAGDVKLTITKRDLLITTGSDTMHFDDEEPAYTAKNETYTTQGLASTDHIIPDVWVSITSGEADNVMTYEILHENGNGVLSNYNITTDWGLLRIRHASEADLYYRIMGICKNITSSDTDKIHIKGLKHIDGLLRMVDEDRFYPALHKLMPISEDGEVDPDDVICIIPTFKHGKKIENVTWMFENKSTGEKIFSKVHDRPIFPDGNYRGARPAYQNYGGLSDTPVLNVVPKELKPGYYDITLNYRVDNTDYSQKFSSVFVIKKKI